VVQVVFSLSERFDLQAAAFELRVHLRLANTTLVRMNRGRPNSTESTNPGGKKSFLAVLALLQMRQFDCLFFNSSFTGNQFMFSKWNFASGMAVLLAAVLVGDLAAQQRRGGGFGLGTRGSLVGIASREAVQTELGLDQAAKDKIEALNEKYGADTREQMQGLLPGGFQDATAEERQKAQEKMAEIGRTLNAKYTPQLKEILSADQFARLQQISWQAAGSQALTDEELAKQLALTQEQKDKIAAVNREYAQKLGGLRRGGGGGGNFQEAAARMRELNQQRDKAAEEILNKEQQDKLAQLKGKPFDVSQLQGFGGRRGRGRGQN
jgi:hypothetical protein